MNTNGYNMNSDNGNKKTVPGKSGNSLGVGILAGMIIGVALAAAVVWFLKRSPSPFVNREQPAFAKPDVANPDVANPAPPAVTGQPGETTDGKQRFQFYKILTDQQKTTPVAPAKQGDQAKTVDKNQPAAYQLQILQAGSFPNIDDAENLKAKLALLGVEANIQTAAIKDKGVWYRVRLGPYKNADELNRARGFLKQNGVNSTPMRVQ
jgi:cell division protein FtsN